MSNYLVVILIKSPYFSLRPASNSGAEGGEESSEEDESSVSKSPTSPTANRTKKFRKSRKRSSQVQQESGNTEFPDEKRSEEDDTATDLELPVFSPKNRSRHRNRRKNRLEPSHSSSPSRNRNQDLKQGSAILQVVYFQNLPSLSKGLNGNSKWQHCVLCRKINSNFLIKW